MRKLLATLMSILTIFSLCSCGKVNKNISFSGETWQTLKVEIYYLEKSYSESDVHNLRDENTPVCVLDNLADDGDVISDLISEISSLAFSQEVIYFPAPVDWIYVYEGYVICVVYPNGYDIIAENGQFYYSFDPKGKENYKYGHCDYSGESEWSGIVEKYVSIPSCDGFHTLANERLHSRLCCDATQGLLLDFS